MVRPRQQRKSSYRLYYERDHDDREIPESTLRSKKARLQHERQAPCEDGALPGSPELNLPALQCEGQVSCHEGGYQPCSPERDLQLTNMVVQTANASFVSEPLLGRSNLIAPFLHESSDADTDTSLVIGSPQAVDQPAEPGSCVESNDGSENEKNSHSPCPSDGGSSPSSNGNGDETSSSSSEQDRQDGGETSSSSENENEENDSDENQVSHQGSESENQEDEDPENQAIQTDPFQRLKASFEKELNLTVRISQGQVLSNALALAKKHNWSHLEKEGLMKFANSILNNGSILPDSRFLIDQHFFSKKDMHYFFYCCKCSVLLGQAPASASLPSQIVCPTRTCKTVNELSDLSKASFFVLFDIPSQIQLVLSDNSIRSKLVNPVDFNNEPEDNVMRDLYHGTMYQSFAQYIKDNISPEFKVLSFTLSVDSASLCSFSGQKICPCFLMLNELPPVLRMENLLIAGLWFGTRKEKMDLYLPPIVDNITALSTKGFKLNFGEEIWNCNAYLIACCADSVARCDVQGIHGHRGDFPCSWCLIEGEEDGNKRVFRFEIPPSPARTLEELVEDAYASLDQKVFVNGVKYLSPLAKAPLFHSVSGFIVDQMHAKDEGNTKSFFKAWLGEEGRETSFLSSVAKSTLLTSRMMHLRPPKEFRKSIRSIEDFAHWTGRELENWGLFISTPSLVDIVPQRYLKHWSLYVQAMHILLSDSLQIQALDVAESLLLEFCRQTEGLYGTQMMRFNLHLLCHFVENSRRWGPSFALSAYAFEAGNQRLKKLIHDVNFIPNQICRGISENNAMLLIKRQYNSLHFQSFVKNIEPKQHSVREKSVGNVKLIGISKPYKASDEEQWFLERMGKENEDIEEYPILIKDGCHFGPDLKKRNKTDNSFARLHNGHIAKIKLVLHCPASDEIYIVSHRVRCKPSSYCPQSVINFDPSQCFLYTVDSIDEDVQFHDVEELKSICVNMPLQHDHFISPMPNIFNMF